MLLESVPSAGCWREVFTARHDVGDRGRNWLKVLQFFLGAQKIPSLGLNQFLQKGLLEKEVAL